MLLKSGQKIVFFGDSITEADPGYVSYIKETLSNLHPEVNVEIINRGVGGNKVNDLLARAQNDVISLDPHWISIAIGINDCWHGPDGNTPQEFESGLSSLIELLKNKTSANLVLCTPSVIGEDPDCEDNQKLAAYVEAVRRVAAASDIKLIDMHEVFLASLRKAREVTNKPLFTTDGVHLNIAGNTLYGTTWLKAMGAFDGLLP